MEPSMLIRFEPQDTLFFREARPMEAQGVKPLGGRFPPPARTVAGAVRSLIGEAMNVDWERYRNEPNRAGHEDIERLIGPPDVEPPGPLLLTGPFPLLNSERLFPVPLFLLQAKNGGGYDYGWLKPGEAVDSDLGRVRLPMLDRELEGAKPLDDYWLNHADFLRVLRGDLPEKPIPTEGKNGLVDGEPRLGIAMEYPRRGAIEGQLYQTVHARPHSGVGVGVHVAHKAGIELPNLNEAIVRFGGEGRFVHVAVEAAQSQGLMPKPPERSERKPAGLILVLLTPANFRRTGGHSWLLPSFEADQRNGVTVWRGKIAEIELTLVSAVIGKAIREGGWDLRAHAPRPAETLLPAGSVFFCETDDPVAAAGKLAAIKLGEDVALGRGEIAVGYWFD